MLWMYAVCALALLVCLPCFMHYKGKLRYRLAASYKALGTLCAASLALIAAIRLDDHCWICFAGLLLHAAADFVLEFHLYFGAGLFLAGHICYIGFFAALFPVSGTHLILFLGLAAISAFLLWRWRGNLGKQLPVYALYAVILSVMCAFAIAGLTAHTLQGILTAVAGALFYLSNALMLGRQLFTAGTAVNWIIMITYYAAQLLFGISCLLS